MCVNGCVSGCASQVLFIAEWNMGTSARIAVLLGQAEIDHVNYAFQFAKSHNEVIGLKTNAKTEEHTLISRCIK